MPVAGSAVLLAVTFRSTPDGPAVDATDVSMTINLGSVLIAGPFEPPALDRVGVGRYEYEWDVPATATPGTYTVTWSGVLPGASTPTVGYETVHIASTDPSADDEWHSFVTTTQLKDYMSGIGLDADQASSMQDVLDGLQRELERYCQRRFNVTAYVETITPDEWGRLWPKNTPVLDVLEPAGFVPNGNEIAGVVGYGLGGYGPVTVTYVAGLDAADLADVRRAILQVAAREATSLHSDVLDPNDLTKRPARDRDGLGLGWTDKELAKFDRLRRRTVA
jgi:hypothetical protein